MLSRRSADWGWVRATLITRPPISEIDQAFCLPWHVFRLGVSGRFAPGSTQRLDGGAAQALRCRSDGAAFYPAGTRIANAITSASRLTYLMVEIDRSAPGEAALRPIVALTDQLCLSLLEALRQALDYPPQTARLFSESAAMTLLLAVSRVERDPLQRPRGGLTPRHLARVTDYIADRLAEPIGLDELSALAGLSPSHFCRAFRRSTGFSPHRWQIRARIARAKELMLGSDLPLAAIALATGFSDQSHLTTVFRRAEGVPPAVWRRTVQS